MDASYLEKYLLSPGAQAAIDAMKTGGNESGLNLTHDRFRPLLVPIAPLNEQRRIASKVDELFSRIDEGERALDRTQSLVDHYRQSVLRAAVTGELTREWRDKNKGKLESGEGLLKSILSARRGTWEKCELDKMKARGSSLPNDWRERYRDPPGPAKTSLPELPDGWSWSCLGQLFQVAIGSTPSRKEPTYWGGGIPWVSSGEVAFCRIGKTKETISAAGFENSSVRAHPPGTVLLAMIGEGKTRGQAAILDIEACHNQNSASIAVAATPVPSEYVYYFLLYRYERVRSMSQGGNQQALNGDLVKSIVIPLPPLLEIAQICEKLNRQWASLAAIESGINSIRKRIEAQRQAVLRDAFKGKLVKQDPKDAPASALLENIAHDRASAPMKSTRPTRSSKSAA